MGQPSSFSEDRSMLSTDPHPTLFRLDECPDLLIDACLCDEQRSLIFLSAWGRDTALQAFLARLTLGFSEGGLTQFHVVDSQDVSHPVFPGSVAQLDKRTTRAFRRTLFGSLVHLWLFDKRCIKPDKANASALALFTTDTDDRDGRLWALIRETCPLPLLDHWREPVMALLHSREMLTTLPPALGHVDGYRLAIDLPELTRELSTLIRHDVLRTLPARPIAELPLHAAD